MTSQEKPPPDRSWLTTEFIQYGPLLPPRLPKPRRAMRPKRGRAARVFVLLLALAMVACLAWVVVK